MGSGFHEISRLRDKTRVFADREGAGKVLAEMLSPYYLEVPDGLVVAIPSGGVPVGIQVASRLLLRMELCIVRKIPVPGNPEAGLGALALDGGMYLNEDLIRYLHLSPGDVEAQLLRVREELVERNRIFRGNRPHLQLHGEKVILVDDGLASGFTMLAAVDAVRRGGAEEVVVAVPTSSEQGRRRIEHVADEVFCPNFRTGHYYAVADAYENWYDLDRHEVVDMLASLPSWMYPRPGRREG